MQIRNCQHLPGKDGSLGRCRDDSPPNRLVFGKRFQRPAAPEEVLYSDLSSFARRTLLRSYRSGSTPSELSLTHRVVFRRHSSTEEQEKRGKQCLSSQASRAHVGTLSSLFCVHPPRIIPAMHRSRRRTTGNPGIWKPASCSVLSSL